MWMSCQFWNNFDISPAKLRVKWKQFMKFCKSLIKNFNDRLQKI